MNKENTENVNRSNEPEKAAAGPLTVIYTDTVYGKEAEALYHLIWDCLGKETICYEETSR